MIDSDTTLAMHRLAREQMKAKLLADILFDMQVCQLEGWDVLEYLLELQVLIASIVAKESKIGNPD